MQSLQRQWPQQDEYSSCRRGLVMEVVPHCGHVNISGDGGSTTQLSGSRSRTAPMASVYGDVSASELRRECCQPRRV